MKNKNFVYIISFIIIFMFISVGYLFNLYEIQKQRKEFMNILYDIENVNLKINFVIYAEKRIYNFDYINNEIAIIKNDINKLKYSPLYNDYKNDVDLLENKFNKKLKLIERFNSFNAINVSTVIYLLSVSENIKEQVKNDKKIDEAVYELFKKYLGIEENEKFFHTDDKYLKPYFEYVNSVIKKLNKINNIREKIKKNSFDNEVQIIFNKFKQENKYVTDKINNNIYFLIIIDILMIIILAILLIRVFIFRKKIYEFKIAVDKSNNSVMFLDKKGYIYYINENFERNSGYKKDELLNKHISYYLQKVLSKEDNEYKNIIKSLENVEKYTKILKLTNKNSNIIYKKVLLYPVYYENRFSNYVMMQLDMTEEIKQKKEIEYIAYHDLLTGLYNRKKMIEDLEKLINQKKEFELVFANLSKFKFINDAFSHSIGDEILIKLSKIFVKNGFKNIYRTGGDEFAFIFFENTQQQIQKIINLCKEITINDYIFNIDLNIGAVKHQNETINDLLKFIDIALEECKKTDNKYVVFDKNLYQRYKRETEIIKLLPNALKNNELYVVYQPKYEIYTKKTYSLEALIRWKNPILGKVFPDEFVPITEERNLIGEIDNYVLEQAIKDFKEFKKIYPYLKTVSVNLSGVELIKKDLDQKLLSIVKQNNGDIKTIDFEVTETYLILDIDYSAKTLQKLKEIGSKISIDDFGTGYSSLYYLSKMPFDTIKIDKTFVDNIEFDNKSKEMIKIIVTLANTFDLNVIAEGVENVKQENILLNLGVTKAQGYLYSKPLTKEKLIEFLQKI